MWLAACCLVAALNVTPPARAWTEGVRVNRALLIGVDEFVSRASTYPSSTNNVFAMQEALQASSDPFDTIMIPAVPVSNVRELSRLIHATFAASDADDVNYLYICTHGEYDPDSGNDPALLLSDGAQGGAIDPPNAAKCL